MAEHNQLQKSEHEIHLEFSLGPLHFCAPAAEVETIISPPKMSVVPASAGVMISCFNHQGRTVTVIDLHSKFGLPFTLDKNRTHIILATVENELKGFWVDRALDIVPLSSFEKDKSGSHPLSNAYFNFLLRDQEIVLQTSFLQLFKCQSSDLYWAPDNETVAAVQADAALEPVTTECSERTTGTEHAQTETADRVPQLEHTVSDKQSRVDGSIVSSKQADHEDDPDKLVVLANRAVIRQSVDTSNKYHTGLTILVNSALRASPAAASNNGDVSIKAHEHKIENLAERRSNIGPENNPASDSKNISDNKQYKFIWLATAMLAVLALGFVLDYLLQVNARSEAASAARNAGAETVAVNKTQSEKAEPSAEVQQIEAAASSAEKSDNESLNIIAQEPEAGAALPKTARVFELHVSEQNDSASYAITGFSPATEQPPAANQPAVNRQQYTHVVVKGDTLWHITRRYLHDPNRYRELAAASDIDNPHRIYPGDVIKIIVNKK